MNENDKPEGKSKIFETFLETPGLTRATVAAQVEKFTEDELHAYLRECSRFNGTMTTPAAASFLNKFQAAKKNKKEFKAKGYHGFRNFDAACPALTGFSSQQIRNYAKGYKTPPQTAAKKPVQHLTEEDLKNRVGRRELQARIDEAAAQARYDNLQKTEAANNSARDAVKKEGAIVSNPVRSTVVVNPVARRDTLELDKGVVLINRFLHALPPSKLSAEQKALKTDAIAYLKGHGGVTEAPFPAERKAAGRPEKLPDEKLAENDKKTDDILERMRCSDRTLKNEPSQGSAPDQAFDPHNPAANKAKGLIHGRPMSENAKGTGAVMQTMSGEVFEAMKRSSHQVV